MSTRTPCLQFWFSVLSLVLLPTLAWFPSNIGRPRPLFLKASQHDDESMGFNELQTLLRDAVQGQDFQEAGRLSDILVSRLHEDDPPKNDEEKRLRKRRMSWRGQGAAPWLVDRLDSLNYTFPTTIQINAMEAVNAILNTTEEVLESASFEERVDLSGKDLGLCIMGTTGSGKTLAYLVPLLSTLSDSLFTRQRIRVGAEQNVGDITGDLLERVAMVTSPVVRSKSRRQIRAKTTATGAAISTLGKSGKDVKSPLALIVVPTRELGVQTAMLLYQLVGGNVKKDATALPGKENMFKYKGPKGVKIGCILEDEEAEFGLKLQTDIAITTPKYLGKLITDGDVKPSMLRVIVYDEADLALEQTDDKVLSELFDDDPQVREYVRLSMLVGATFSLGDIAVRSRILPGEKSYLATAFKFSPLGSMDTIIDGLDLVGSKPKREGDSLKGCLDPGLRHERVVVNGKQGLLALTRLLRKELRDYERLQGTKTETEIQRPRVVVFFPDEATAKASISPLRDAMWGEHKLCVLLPTTGFNPLEMMEKFKNNETTVMLATPNSVRGLDFPALTHVYTLYLPTNDPREYVHLAGRVGRVGQMGSVRGAGGHVVSILTQEEADGMEKLADQLGFDFVDTKPVEEDMPGVVLPEDGDVELGDEQVDKVRRYLEDTLTLLELEGEDPEDNPQQSSVIDVKADVVDADAENEDEPFQ